MRSLARQKPQFRRGHSLLAKLLIAGDFPLALVARRRNGRGKTCRAPVDWVRTLDPVITSPSQVRGVCKGPHPNAARLFRGSAAVGGGPGGLSATADACPRATTSREGPPEFR